jgi:hypothetical protein
LADKHSLPIDALALSPVRARIYVVLKRPYKHAGPEQVDGIDKAARAELLTSSRVVISNPRDVRRGNGLRRQAVKSENRYQQKFAILAAVEDLLPRTETRVMQRLGINWWR